jgi:hypothetical protein
VHLTNSFVRSYANLNELARERHHRTTGALSRIYDEQPFESRGIAGLGPRFIVVRPISAQDMDPLLEETLGNISTRVFVKLEKHGRQFCRSGDSFVAFVE